MFLISFVDISIIIIIVVGGLPIRASRGIPHHAARGDADSKQSTTAQAAARLDLGFLDHGAMAMGYGAVSD